MSQAIQDAVEIAQIVYDRIKKDPSRNVRIERLNATKKIARNRGVSNNAVCHSITLALSPTIWYICEFDKLLKEWTLQNKRQNLVNKLDNHAKDTQDDQAIANLP